MYCIWATSVKAVDHIVSHFACLDIEKSVITRGLVPHCHRRIWIQPRGVLPFQKLPYLSSTLGWHRSIVWPAFASRFLSQISFYYQRLQGVWMVRKINVQWEGADLNHSRLNVMSTDFTYLNSLVDASFVNLIGMIRNKWQSVCQ